jgi:signal peptidase I
MNEETPKKSTLKEVIKEIIIFLVIAGGIVVPFRVYVAEPYLVDGRSMDPTFATGDYLIVDKISKNARFPERNAVIVFDFPNDTSKSFIKRVIGLPGETVVIKNNTVTIINSENPDGITLDQSYVTHAGQGFYQKTLEGDEYFVMGDNRAESYDSRYWGPLKRSFILGRPIVRLFPINKIDSFPGNLN